LRLAVAAISSAAGVALVELGSRAITGGAGFTPAFFTLHDEDPGFGLAAGTEQTYLHAGRRITVTIDASGRRVVPGAAATGDKREIHVVGDSQVFGWGLSDGETLPAQLQRVLGTEYRIINHGLPASGPFRYVSVLSEVPDDAVAVVVFSETNDYSDSYSARSSVTVLCNSLVPRGHWLADVPCAWTRLHVFQRLLSLKVALSYTQALPVQRSLHHRAASQVLDRRIRALFADESRRRSRKLLFVSIPWDGAVVAERIPAQRRAFAVPPFASLPSDVDLGSRFRQVPRRDALYQPNDDHLSPLGAALVAEAIAAELRLRSAVLSPG
jgi:hypothetical protein